MRFLPSKPLLVIGVLALALGLPLFAQEAASAVAPQNPALFPLTDVKPGMKGVVYTIFSGDQVEKVDLEVIGILHNALGPKEDIILVKLLGDKAAQTGVAAGMSGSPVFFDGKLAGALSLKLGAFTKDAIGGVTPIADMLDVEKFSASDDPGTAVRAATVAKPSDNTTGRGSAAAGNAGAAIGAGAESPRIDVPDGFLRRISVGDSDGDENGRSGQFLVPIETPLIYSGLFPETALEFGKELSGWGMSMMAGGTEPASNADADVKPGDMVGIDLIRGDLSISSGCTVTMVEKDRLLACGHPLFSFGSVQMPLSRAHVVMTLASSSASTKVITTGGTIGTLTQDRQTAIMGTLGAGPRMIPVDVTLHTPSVEKEFHFEVIENAQLTPTLVALAAYNGIIGSPAYREGSTLQLEGGIELQGHTAVQLEDLFAPTDTQTPTGMPLALAVQDAFLSIYSNPYEQPKIQGVHLRVTALTEHRWATIDNAWIEKTEVRPGESTTVKVLLRPYRGDPFIQEIPITIPAQAARGTLQLVVSDASYLNRNVQSAKISTAGQLTGLEELVKLINHERRNDCVFVTLLQPTPTLFLQDKEMPNVPASAINVLNQRQTEGARVQLQSTAGEWSVEMHQVVQGLHTLTLTVK
jgi:hypothetical protein